MALINKLQAIGDAIREKTGETAELTLDEMAAAISNLPTGSGTLQTAVISTDGNTLWVNNYVDPGDSFILFYTAKSSSSGNYIRSMWMSDWSKNVYNLAPNNVSGDSVYLNAGIKQLSTSLIDASNTMTTLTNKTNSTIRFDGYSLSYDSDTGCKIGNSAVLLYVG